MSAAVRIARRGDVALRDRVPFLHETCDFLFGHGGSDVGSAAPDEVETVIAAGIRKNRRVQDLRSPDLDSRIVHVEPPRHDSDDFLRLAVDLHTLADDRRLAAERALPEFPGQDRDG